MQAPFDIPADLDTPVSAYLKLRPLRPLFLLESVSGSEEQARYSFIGLDSAFDVRLDSGGFRSGERLFAPPESVEDLLALLRQALAAAPRLEPEVAGLPFAGGLVGIASYELAQRFAGISFARRDPRVPELHYVAPRAVIVFDHRTRRIALLSSGGEPERSALRREVLALLRGPLPSPRPRGSFAPPRPSLDRSAFVDRVERAHEAIRAGEAYQLVLSTRFDGATDLDPLGVYRALRLTNPSPYMFLLELGDLAAVGASPEALVRLSGRRASLHPIAGTRSRGDDAEHDRTLERDLLDDPKEASEHVMLVDLARNDLGRVAVPGSIRVEPFRAIERYSHVMHLVSGVSGLLEAPHDAFDLFAASFPAGTVTGAPKRRAMELIDELEGAPRGLYAGTVGYFGHGGAMDQAITIRTVVLSRGAYAYQAGAGIVLDSDPGREFDELLAKGAAMRGALELAAEEL